MLHKLRLEVKSPTFNYEQEFTLIEDYLIGRSKFNLPHICIPLPHISRRHARLVKIRNRDGFIYRILDGAKGKPSTYGTFVNGESIKVRDLTEGDVIWLGGIPSATTSVIATYFIYHEDSDTLDKNSSGGQTIDHEFHQE